MCGAVCACASLRPRRRSLGIDERTEHYYQPGWLFVPFDIYSPEGTVKPIAEFFEDCAEVLIPELNYEGQFANLVAAAVPRRVTRLNRVPGVPMPVDDILNSIRSLANRSRPMAAE